MFGPSIDFLSVPQGLALAGAGAFVGQPTFSVSPGDRRRLEAAAEQWKRDHAGDQQQETPHPLDAGPVPDAEPQGAGDNATEAGGWLCSALDDHDPLAADLADAARRPTPPTEEQLRREYRDNEAALAGMGLTEDQYVASGLSQTMPRAAA